MLQNLVRHSLMSSRKLCKSQIDTRWGTRCKPALACRWECADEIAQYWEMAGFCPWSALDCSDCRSAARHNRIAARRVRQHQSSWPMTVQAYRFEKFELGPSSRTFSRDGSKISLYPKAFEILIYLAANPGRVVTKEEIFKDVWLESFAEEGNLARQVSSLRRAMGDRADCIVTIPGPGYQFAAKIQDGLEG